MFLSTPPTTTQPAPLPPVNVYAEDARASQVGPDRGLFTFTRSAHSKSAPPVTINYTLSGTARNGKDYQQLGGSITIATGHTWVSLPVIPLKDTFTEGTRRVVLTLQPGPGYTVGSLRSAVVIIDHGQTAPTPRPTGKWPSAPFNGDPYANSIFVNQLGNATIKSRLRKSGQIDGYTLFFDDGGSDMTVQSAGSLPTQMAFYNAAGKPTLAAAYQPAVHGARLSAPDPPDRRMHYLAVRAANGKSTGPYTLRVHGPAANFVERLAINPRNDAASSGSDISGDGDCDFYQFTTTKAGNWTVWVRPDNKQLDAEFTVFDAKGTPVAGSFTRPVDAGGNGVTESWTGLNLPANATYFIRVDGHADSLGGYGVALMKTDQPLLSIAATQPKATSTSKPGIITITRAGSAIPLVPLHVRYTISGTARNGIDFVRLSGTATFTATAYTTTVKITPLAGAIHNKNVILTLRPDPYYALSKQTQATVTL